MKKGWIIALTAVSLVIIISLLAYFAFKPNYICGTPFDIRDSETGQCKIYVGCSLPKGVTEDLTCKEILKQQIDGAEKDNLDVCDVDSDCIVVNYSHCCGSTKKAINKENLAQYNAHPAWQVFNEYPVCGQIGQCAPDNYVNRSICKEGTTGKRCTLVY